MRTDWTDEEFETELKRRESIRTKEAEKALLYAAMTAIDRGATNGGVSLTQSGCKALSNNWGRSLTGLKITSKQFEKFYDALGLAGYYPVQNALQDVLNITVSDE